MREFIAKGNPFESGKIIGKSLSTSIKYRLRCFDFKRLKKEKDGLLSRFYHKCLIECPDYISEIKGIAEGSGTPVEEIFFLNVLEIQEVNRCSTIVSMDKHLIIAHNEDADPLDRKKDFSLIERKNEKERFFSFCYPGELLGSSFGWNSYGLIITVNNVRYKTINEKGLPRVFIARKIISSKSIDEAISILRETECASAFHYTLVQNKRVVSVEQRYKEISVKEIDKTYFHTNHFLNAKFHKDAIISRNSKVRYDRIKELLEKKKAVLEILFDRKNKPYPIYNKIGDASKTVATFVAYPLENFIRIYSSERKKDYIERDIK